MQKIWQKEWFGIRFNEFTSVDENKIADEDFYHKFYDIFFNRFSGYNDLPSSWLESKSQIANDIYLHFRNNNNILSIGCGIGYIKTVIFNLMNDSIEGGNNKLVAIDPNITDNRWIPDGIDFRQGFFPDAVRGERFEVAYTSVIDYAMEDNKYCRFLNDVYDYGIKEFMLTDLHTGQLNWEFKHHFKELFKTIYYKIGLSSRQFWGYLRSFEEHLQFLKSSGFRKFEVGEHSNNSSYWIKAIR